MVMPNHTHGILEIKGNIDNGNGGDIVGDVGRDVVYNVSTTTDTTSQLMKKQMSKISPKSGAIDRIIGSYKGAVSKHAHRLGLQFGWQSRFYDHIIRNGKSLERIQSNIINNSKN